MGLENLPRTVDFRHDASGEAALCIVDQRLLPEKLVLRDLTAHGQAIEAIKDMSVRGAPVLGVVGAAALGLWAENECPAASVRDLLEQVPVVARAIATARPTAVNLSWGVDRAVEALRESAARGDSLDEVRAAAMLRAQALARDDERRCRAIGGHGATLLRPGSRVLTHCNAGSLATAFYGTALGVVYTAFEQGRIERVYADETRPLGQGARLTAWELSRVGVPCTLQCDDMSAALMAQGRVDAVIVGADRICRNGDTANKIGTYALAIAAEYHKIPFYVAAPTSTIDASLREGGQIPIEVRDPAEIYDPAVLPVEMFNPAFDVTPAPLINGIITENGIIRPSIRGDGSLFDLVF